LHRKLRKPKKRQPQLKLLLKRKRVLEHHKAQLHQVRTYPQLKEKRLLKFQKKSIIMSKLYTYKISLRLLKMFKL
jgi:hypothetical protein